MRRQKVPKKFESEKEMCDVLIKAAQKSGFTSYPEQGGWDIVLVRNKVQVGIQAKLRPNLKVVSQAISSFEGREKPHYAAIAVGNIKRDESADLCYVANKCGIVVINMSNHVNEWLAGNKGRNWIWSEEGGFVKFARKYRIKSDSRIWLPEFVPDLEAGIKSPKTVSKFMVIAIKVQEECEKKGWICVDDIRDIEKKYLNGDNRSYARTILNVYYQCTSDRVEGKRCWKWKPNRWATRPREQFPHVAEGLL